MGSIITIFLCMIMIILSSVAATLWSKKTSVAATDERIIIILHRKIVNNFRSSIELLIYERCLIDMEKAFTSESK